MTHRQSIFGSTFTRPLSYAAALAGLVALGACSDNGIAPTPRPEQTTKTQAVTAGERASGTSAGIATGSLSNGANVTGSIAAAGQVDTWTFSATQGQYLEVAIGEVSGTADFTPWIRLQDPNGATIGNQWNAGAAQIALNAPLTGTYTVLVATADNGNDATGTYTLMAAWLPGSYSVSPGDQGGAMANGSNHSGSLTVGDVDVWSFSAAQGDYISLAIGESAGSTDFNPWIRLIGPNGSVVGNQWNAAAAQIAVNAASTGTYTVLVSTADAGNDGTGTYNLTLAMNPGPITISPGDQGGAMTNGANHTGSIFVGDTDAWTFTANQGDYIGLAVGEVTGSAGFTPWIRLVSPNGTVIGNQWNAAAAQIATNAPLTGTYMVIVSTADAGNDDTGDYNLTLTRAPAALTTSPGDQGSAMTNGLTYTGTIFVGDLDSYTFNANQGDYIGLAAGEITGSAGFTPWIRLISPNGTLIGNQWNAAAAQIGTNAPLSGTYTVIVSTADAGNDDTGDYRLTLARSSGTLQTSPGDEGGPATNGGNNLGSISVGDIDVFTFTTNVGLPFAVNIGETAASSPDFTPWIRVIAPNGVVVGNAWNVAAAQISVFAKVSGVYTVIVSTADGGNDATGNYQLIVQRGGAFVTPPGDDGGAIANGAVQSGTITVGDIDRWTFQANQGDYLALSAGELSGSDFSPWIRLVSPSGKLLGNTWNSVVAQINAAAPETGNYTVAIASADGGNDGTGTYNLTLAKGPGAFVVQPGDQGGAISNGVQNGAIAAGGDLDMWSVTATQGSPLSLTVTETSGTPDYTPWIRLVSPTGALVGNAWNASSAAVNLTAPVTGTYTIVLGTADGGNDATGSYTLSVSGVNMAPRSGFVESVGDLQAFLTPTPTSYDLDRQRIR
ncbi:MAG: hypothetical protein MNPFHGCM_00513 [Gemmatimonadaceae bacterium]|nr:hypothetical protein [Gemmatimonadaceae bacterium]